MYTKQQLLKAIDYWSRFLNENNNLEPDYNLKCICDWYKDEIINFREIKFKELNIEYPTFLYHMTTPYRLDSININGIQPMPLDKKLWKGCDNLYTYWTRNITETLGFIPNSLNELIIFKSHISNFDLNKLFVDRMWTSNFDEYEVPITFEYKLGMPASKIIQMTLEEIHNRINYEKTHTDILIKYY